MQRRTSTAIANYVASRHSLEKHAIVHTALRWRHPSRNSAGSIWRKAGNGQDVQAASRPAPAARRQPASATREPQTPPEGRPSRRRSPPATTDTFDVLVRRFVEHPNVPVNPLRHGSPWHAALVGAALRRARCDAFILRFHDFLKADAQFQATCFKRAWEFPSYRAAPCNRRRLRLPFWRASAAGNWRIRSSRLSTIARRSGGSARRRRTRLRDHSATPLFTYPAATDSRPTQDCWALSGRAVHRLALRRRGRPHAC